MFIDISSFNIALGLSSCFVIVYLLYHKSKIRKRPSRKVFETTRRIAHRGSRIEYPENTMEAFKFAFDQHADMIELDVWYTQDMKIVVFHDGDLYSCTGLKNQHVNDLDFKDLPSIQVPTKDMWLQGQHRRKKTYRIPLLSDVLKLLQQKQYKSKNILVEIKETKNYKIVSEVYEMLKFYSLLDRSIWFSLKSKTNNIIRAYQRTFPVTQQIPTLPSVMEVIRT